MKTIINTLRLNIAALLIASSAFCAPSTDSTLVANWKTSSLKEASSPGADIPDIIGQNNLLTSKETSGYIVADENAPGGKGLVFAGDQSAAVTSRQKIILDGNVLIQLSAKAEAGSGWQSLLYLYRFIELRYNLNRRSLLLIVWPADGGKPVEIACPMNTGVWNTISATVHGKELALTVNGFTSKGILPDDRPMGEFNNKLTIGQASQRPFTGSVANISIITLKP